MGAVFVVPVAYQVAFGFYSRELYQGVLWLPVPEFTLENFTRALTETEYLQSLAWTVGVALLTSVVSIALALPVAWHLARNNPAGRPLIELSFLLPVFGEVFSLYALAYALTPNGPVNWILETLGLRDEPLHLERNPWIAVAWMAIPTLSVLLIRGAFAGVDVLYEEAAQTMGASPWATFRHVTLPMARRGIVGALLLSGTAAVGAYTIPLILVGPTNTWLTTKIQREVNPYYNFPMASALGVILTVICAAGMYAYLRVSEE